MSYATARISQFQTSNLKLFLNQVSTSGCPYLPAMLPYNPLNAKKRTVKVVDFVKWHNYIVAIAEWSDYDPIVSTSDRCLIVHSP